MTIEPHPFTKLRRKIRYSGKEFRRDNDNSQSLFHPKGGFVHAYDIEKVEQALDEFERSLANKPEEAESPEEQILRMARSISNHHPSADAQELANAVIKYLTPYLPSLYERSTVTVIDWDKPDQ